MASANYRALEAALAQAGAPTSWSISRPDVRLEREGSVAALDNTRASAVPYAHLLLAALPRLAGMEQEMVIRALSERGMPEAGPVLADMMLALNESGAGGMGWALGNALATIADVKTYDAVLALCADRQRGASRQMLFSLLPRIGTQAAYEVAVAGLADESVRGHALEALGRFGRPEALPVIRSVPTQKGLYEHKAQATAIRRLERAAARRRE